MYKISPDDFFFEMKDGKLILTFEIDRDSGSANERHFPVETHEIHLTFNQSVRLFNIISQLRFGDFFKSYSETT